MDFQFIFSDSCVFVNVKKHLIIVFYVNNLLVINKTKKTVKSFKQEIMKTYKMKNMNFVKIILNIQIQIRLNQSMIILNQINYFQNFLQELEINSNIKKTQFMQNYNALIFSEFYEKWANKQHYQHVIDKLMYIMKDTRSDLCFVLSKLSQFCLDLSIRHKNILNDLFQYVNNIVDYVLIFKKKTK